MVSRIPFPNNPRNSEDITPSILAKSNIYGSGNSATNTNGRSILLILSLNGITTGIWRTYKPEP